MFLGKLFRLRFWSRYYCGKHSVAELTQSAVRAHSGEMMACTRAG